MTRGRNNGVVRGKKGRARRERSAGGVVYRRDAGDVRSTPHPPDSRVPDGRSATDVGPLFLLICDSYGKWGFPKGHLERGERAATAALREVMEETGLRSLKLIGSIATIEWYFRLHGDLIHKNCQYFLMETDAVNTRPQESEGISACRWATLSEARDLIPYDNARVVLQQAHDMIVRPAPVPG
jgi:bis(5'-nucleosidyl)-tetraphosphatase